MTSTLYLDFDGVLHPDSVYFERGEMVLYSEEGLALFEWAPVLSDLLAPHPDIRIILATSWVSVLGYDAALVWLPLELKQRVVGATWSESVAREWQQIYRYEQIANHAGRNGLEHWIALDDNVLGWPTDQADRLVYTDGQLGLGAPRAQRRLRDRLEWLAAQNGGYALP